LIVSLQSHRFDKPGVEARIQIEFDILGLMQQLGVIPAFGKRQAIYCLPKDGGKANCSKLWQSQRSGDEVMGQEGIEHTTLSQFAARVNSDQTTKLEKQMNYSEKTQCYKHLLRLIHVTRALETGGIFDAAKYFWALAFVEEIRASDEIGLPSTTEERNREIQKLGRLFVLSLVSLSPYYQICLDTTPHFLAGHSLRPTCFHVVPAELSSSKMPIAASSSRT